MARRPMRRITNGNVVKPIKTAVEVDIYLKTEYLAILKIDDRNIRDHFQISSRMDVQR